ncbi:MAG: M20/M25/M40 family metallo-hydrolase [Planctomycetota bacterium]
MRDATIPTDADAVELLRAMVRVNSINAALPGSAGGETDLVELLETWCREIGLVTQCLAVPGHCDQLLVTYEIDAGRPWLLFDSHLDTVAVEGMTIDPFGAALRDGRVWGRGTCDTKGTGAAMLGALRRYAAGDTQPNNVAVLLSVDEEVGMRGIAHFVERDLPALGWRPAAAVVGEPTELRPVVAHLGCLRWSLTTRGVACHSSVPHEGRSAISAMVEVVRTLEAEYFPTLTAEHDLAGRAVGSINVIRGGEASNIVPASCRIEIDRRTVPGEDAAAELATVARLIEPRRVHGEPIAFMQEIEVDHPPMGTSHNGPWRAVIRDVLRAAGMSTLELGAPFATHGSYLDAAGIPTVVLGPGSPHPAHTADEWVAVEQIEAGVDLYGRLMRAALPPAGATG